MLDHKQLQRGNLTGNPICAELLVKKAQMPGLGMVHCQDSR